MVRSFGEALKHGWQPLRTIVFASFEGEEMSQRGSRSWISENLPWLNRTVVGYLNVVVAASGSQLHVKASPLLQRAAIHVTSKALSPNQTVEGQTVADVWDGIITPAGGGDAIPFSHSCNLCAREMYPLSLSAHGAGFGLSLWWAGAEHEHPKTSLGGRCGLSVSRGHDTGEDS